MILINVLLAGAVSWAIVKLTHNVRLDRFASAAMAGHALLAILTAAGVRRIIRRPSRTEIASAALIVWTILNFVCVLLSPGGSYLTTWPTLLAAFSLATQTLPGSRRWNRCCWCLSVLASLMIVLLLSPAIYVAFVALTVRMAPVMVIAMILSLWLLPARA
jgi:hypothetical protein